MFSLELTNANATLDNFNSRTEKIGPDKVPAADLRITCPSDSAVLANFSPSLRSFIFDLNGPKDLADGVSIRDPHMVFPLARDEEMTGATVQIAYGVGKPIEFTDCRINSFRITPMEGGTVVLTFRVQCRPDEKQAGKLYTLQEQAITLTLTPAELPEIKAA